MDGEIKQNELKKGKNKIVEVNWQHSWQSLSHYQTFTKHLWMMDVGLEVEENLKH